MRHVPLTGDSTLSQLRTRFYSRLMSRQLDERTYIYMKKNTLRVIATLLACATLASGSATAMADEASLPSMDEVPNSAAIEHEAHSLSVQPTADKQYAYPAEAEASGIFPTKNANALQPLNDTDDVPQSRGAVGNVAKALKVAAKIFSGAKWLGDLSGFLQKPEN